MIANGNRYKSSEYGKPLKTPFGIPVFSLNAGTVEMQALQTATFCIGVPFEVNGELLVAHPVNQEESKRKCWTCWFNQHRSGSICIGPRCHQLDRTDYCEVNFKPLGKLTTINFL